jgi:gamma-butyrobetaine dioxygenase
VPLALLRDCARRAQPAAPELPLRNGGGGDGGGFGGEGGFGGGEVGGGVEGAASAFELAAAWHEYSALAASPAARAAAHAQLRACGLVRVRGAPAEPGAGVLGVARLFGIVSETNYGLVFDVRAEAAPTNLAFSARGLGLHTDNPYRRPAPGFQALLCLQPAASGGVTAFADGAAAARALHAADPAAFRLLSGTDATFRFADGAAQLEATRPVIALGRGGEVRGVAVNNRGMAPLAVGGGGAAAGSAEYYRALAEFARLAELPRFGLRVRLERGEAALWDNARLLHGRSGFAGGARWLQGCYLSADSVESNAAVALDRGGAS